MSNLEIKYKIYLLSIYQLTCYALNIIIYNYRLKVIKFYYKIINFKIRDLI